jgi:hypothetical protein
MRFATLSFPCFNVFHDMFYEGNLLEAVALTNATAPELKAKAFVNAIAVYKIIPLNIASLLTPRALAFWLI